MSHAMKLLQAKCGVSADGDFGPNTRPVQLPSTMSYRQNVPPIFWVKRHTKAVGLS
jgi:hypothetical protein